MTRIYLAMGATGGSELTLDHWDWDSFPVSFLVALPYLSHWEKRSAAGGWRPEALMLDSGAYSAFKIGEVIDHQALMAEGRNPRWTERVALDVIGDAEGSRMNADKELAAGCDTIPVFHLGEPWDLLEHYCRRWGKVGISASFWRRHPGDVLHFLEQVFARAWPHRFHLFGCTNRSTLGRFPFHSADSSSWAFAPGAYRQFAGHIGGTYKGVGTVTTRRAMAGQIHHYLDMETELASKWAGDLEKADGKPKGPA